MTEVDQVWCTDITYLPMEKGHAYLVAIMDWKSRAVLSWELSNSMDSSFCVRACFAQCDEEDRPPMLPIVWVDWLPEKRQSMKLAEVSLTILHHR